MRVYKVAMCILLYSASITPYSCCAPLRIVCTVLSSADVCLSVLSECCKQEVNNKQYMHLYFFMLLLHVSAGAASHHLGVQVVITNTSLSDVSLYQHLIADTVIISNSVQFHSLEI